MKKKFCQLIIMGLAGTGVMTLTQLPLQAAAASALDSYDRSLVAEVNYKALHHGAAQFPLSNTDPEYAALMKKYIYGDIAQQVKLEPVERALVTVSVLTTNQNEKLLATAVDEALAVKATPLQIRESVYHITPYVGFAKTAAAVEIMDGVFEKHGIRLPLEKQGTTTDADRFEKGLEYQVRTYGDRITKMRAAAPDNQKHLQDDLSAFCFGDIYTRGTLDLKLREMLTVAAIGTMGIEDQFRSHVNGLLAAGATKEEVVGIITAMNPYVGFPRTLWMLKLVNECFAVQPAQ